MTEHIKRLIDNEKNIIAKRTARNFDNTCHLERLAHLEACAHNDHEFSEVIAISAGMKQSAAQVRCLWCDEIK